jgi:hypothetical protein
MLRKIVLRNTICPFTIKSISTIHGQPVAQHALLRNMIDRVWAPLFFDPKVGGDMFFRNVG